MLKKEYVDPDELDGVLTAREKAEIHLKSWSKRDLIRHILYSANGNHLGQWADFYDKCKK
jgi:hypothetical protein